jgi:hypothetical protein
MIFMPFSRERYALNLIFILDPMYSGILVLSLGIGYWKPGWAQRIAIVGMGGLVLYVGVAAALHAAALDRFRAAVETEGLRVLHVEVYPRLPGPWVWLGLADTPTAIVRGDVDSRHPTHAPLERYPKPIWDGSFPTAGELEEVRAFLEFARFPWMTARREGEHTILEYYDLRFGAAPHHNDFRLEVLLDGGGAVKHIRLNHRF